ncbi:MAG: hypothetical protein K2N14_04445 [Clostridia bacterium]|nr:hypothetical protein [Clostridia bacterium]
MKKIFKTLTIAIIAITAIFACAFGAGCNTDNYKEPAKSDYNFTIVYADGKPVNGDTDGANGKVVTQICSGKNCLPLDLQNIYPDSHGKLNLSQEQVNEIFSAAITVNGDITEFVFHVIGVKGCKNDCEIEVNGKNDYTITLEAA